MRLTSPSPLASNSSNIDYYTVGIPEDTHTLEELYQAALLEGGNLIIYAGGDSPSQQTATKTAFEAKFPGLSAQIIVDLSKIHDARVDNQIATGTLILDIVQLQTTHDFDRWKADGVLLQYKPVGWSQVFPEFRDTDAYFVGLYVRVFSNNINRDLLGDDESGWPTEANDYLNPELKGKIVSTYPNDDDAILFMYKLIIDKYGWDWLAKFVANEPVFVRSTQNPFNFVLNGTYPATFTTGGPLKPQVTRPMQFILPKEDPFVCWAQRAAILKEAAHPAAAKLYLSWWLSIERQNQYVQWNVRKDVPIPEGYRSIFDYPGQTDPTAFQKFMADRNALEVFKGQFQLYVGEVKGDIPTGDLGLHPTEMLPSAFP